MTSVPLSEFGGGGASAAKFDTMGDSHAGIILSMDKRVQTDPNTGTVKTFADGTPRPQWVVTIEEDGGEALSLWAKGGKGSKFVPVKGSGESMLNAITSAVRAAGCQAIDLGAHLTVTFTGLGDAKPQPTKLFTAEYKPGTPGSVPVDDLFS
jgi:hypothetical protein